MVNRLNFMSGKSIRFKLLILLLGISIAAVVIIAAIAVNATQTEGLNAQVISSRALLDQAQSYLVQLNKDSAKQNDLMLENVLNSAQNLASYTAHVYENPEAFDGSKYWPAGVHISQLADGQYGNSDEDISSVFVPNNGVLDEATLYDIETSAYLDFSFLPAFDHTPYVEAIYFATPRNMVRYYPNINLGEVLPADFKATERIWYSGSTLENDPERTPWWTPPYLDATGRGLVTTAAMPVYNQIQHLLGVVGFDVTLNEMRARIEATHFLESGYSFLIDNSGHAIALPEKAYYDILGRAPENGEVGTDLSITTAAFSPIIAEMITGKSGFQSVMVNGQQLFVAYSPLESTGWNLGSVVQAQDVLQSVATLHTSLEDTTRSLIFYRILPTSAAIFLAVLILGLFLTNSLVRPIQNLASAARRFGAGEWDVNIPSTSNDEIGVLANAFKTMSAQLHDLVMQLEQRVQERTRELERRTFQVQIAAQVARDITATRNLEQLLEHAVNLIRDRFGFYHAGVFLIDDRNEYAVIRAATGQAGKEMLAQGHKLRVGETGLVGYATGSGLPRIALDVGKDAIHFRNPLLPETRSEMALPLKVGERIIGALDVQSQEPAAFDEEDITILQIMSDQLAIAIENAYLIQEIQEHLKELEAFYGNYSRQGWEQIVRARPVIGYQYDRSGLSTIQNSENDQETARALSSFPLEVRGTVIGTIDILADEGKLSPQDMALLDGIKEHLSQALESARLFEEARERAVREQSINELTASISRSLNFDTLLQTATRELGKLPNVIEVSIHVGEPEQLSPTQNEAPSNGKAPHSNGRNGR
jgi:nitrate/nitrite-specific signal transduction histidine kinase